MMSSFDIKPALEALKQLGGKYIFADETGEEFVVMRLREDGEKSVGGDQIKLLDENFEEVDSSGPYTEDFYDEEEMESVDLDEDIFVPEKNDGVQVRFEPIKGDLPPELQ